MKPTRRFIPDGVELVHAEIDRVLHDENVVLLQDGRRLSYDYLVIATGTQPRPDQTEGMLDGGQWRESIHEFYTFEGRPRAAGEGPRGARRTAPGPIVNRLTAAPRGLISAQAQKFTRNPAVASASIRPAGPGVPGVSVTVRWVWTARGLLTLPFSTRNASVTSTYGE